MPGKSAIPTPNMTHAIGTALAAAGFAATHVRWMADGAPDGDTFTALDRFEHFNPGVDDRLTEARCEAFDGDTY